MSRPTWRFLAYLAFASTPLLPMQVAEAGVGAGIGGVLSTFAHSAPVQTAQVGECWQQDGADGPGYYPCIGGGGPIAGPGIGRSDRRGAAGVHMAPRAQPAAPGSLGLAGVHEPESAAGAHAGASPGPVGAGASEAVRARAAHPLTTPSAPAISGGALHPGAAAAASHVVGGAVASVPHINAPASPGAAASPHVAAPASLGGVHGVGEGIGHR